MGDRGHRASDGEYEIWATVSADAPLDQLRAHLIDPDLLRRWVPCAQAVTAEGEILRMELLVASRFGGRSIFTGTTRTPSPHHVERSWQLARSVVGPMDRPEQPAAYERDVRFELSTSSGLSTVSAWASTRIPGARARALAAGGKAEATALRSALADLVHLAGPARRKGLLRRWRSATAPAGPL